MNFFVSSFLIIACLSLTSGQTCVDRCGIEDADQPCQCNSLCTDFGDCCADYDSVCYTCDGRCGEAYLFSRPCHCNVDCPDHGNCCSDYYTLCDDNGGDLGAEILALTERLFELDESVGELIELDLTTNNPLFVSVDASAFDSRTFQAFLALRDNYEADVCFTESEDSVEVAELVEFLDAVFATAVMIEVETFLNDNGLVEGMTVREAVEESFMGWYSRCDSNLGSNGFEHSFMGEIDGSSVSGYHNWVSFYQDEQAGTLIFTENLAYADISTKLTALEMAFTWQGNVKEISSMYIGNTPEIELALYTLAFFAGRSSAVDVSLNGYSHQIQTWDISGTNYVGSAYPLL